MQKLGEFFYYFLVNSPLNWFFSGADNDFFATKLHFEGVRVWYNEKGKDYAIFGFNDAQGTIHSVLHGA
jgi:hypothetical protein